jgi:methylglutaconyl-CoA hydratase
MESTTTIRIDQEGPLGRIRLHRPEKHHALNLGMIRELSRAVETLDSREDIRLITLSSAGKHFSAGADLEWMKGVMEQDEQQQLEESMELAGLFRRIASCRKVFLTAVQGRVMGGAIGLVAASDLVLAEESARFAFSEVKLGLIPATIAPFVLHKTGRAWAQARMLTGRSFDAGEAKEGGLVHYTCPQDGLVQALKELQEDLLGNSPRAMAGIKEMLTRLQAAKDADSIQEYTARLLVRYRNAEDGQEGMRAFFEKRLPRWNHAR